MLSSNQAFSRHRHSSHRRPGMETQTLPDVSPVKGEEQAQGRTAILTSTPLPLPQEDSAAERVNGLSATPACLPTTPAKASQSGNADTGMAKRQTKLFSQVLQLTRRFSGEGDVREFETSLSLAAMVRLTQGRTAKQDDW